MQGRQLSEADLDSIRAVRAEHPDWSRQRLSVHLAQAWQWRNEAGRLKDMAVRTLMLKLQARGLIDLPAPLTRNGNHRRCARPSTLLQLDLLSSQPDSILCPLSALQPIGLDRIALHRPVASSTPELATTATLSRPFVIERIRWEEPKPMLPFFWTRLLLGEQVSQPIPCEALTPLNATSSSSLMRLELGRCCSRASGGGTVASARCR